MSEENIEVRQEPGRAPVTIDQSPPAPTAPPVNVVEMRHNGAVEAMQMMSIADKWAMRGDAEKFIAEGKSLAQFRVLLIEKLDKDSKPVITRHKS